MILILNFQALDTPVPLVNDLYGIQQIQDASIKLYRHAQSAPHDDGELLIEKYECWIMF